MEYTEKLKEIDPNLLVYIDEMGCDNKLFVLRGWSLIGDPSYGEVLAYQIQRRSKFDVQILYLPPYSPDLNPIEKVWANFKKILRRVNNSFEKFSDAISYVFNKILSD